MSPGLGQAGLRIAMFIIVTALILVFVVPRDSPEFVVSVLTLIFGVVLAAAITFLVRK